MYKLLDFSEQTELSTWHVCMLKLPKRLLEISEPIFLWFVFVWFHTVRARSYIYPPSPRCQEVTAYMRNEEEGWWTDNRVCSELALESRLHTFQWKWEGKDARWKLAKWCSFSNCFCYTKRKLERKWGRWASYPKNIFSCGINALKILTST